MLLKQLQYFVNVVDCGSFTKTAEQCFITQSAISQQIMALEKELEAELLKRSARSFQLTKAGEYLYHHGKQLLLEVDELLSETKKNCTEF